MASAGTARAPISEPQPPTPTPAIAKPSLVTRVTTGAACFHWIGGLTVLNSLVVIFGGSLHFVLGLAFTAAIDAKARHLGAVGAVLDLLINGTVAGIFFVLGSLAGKRIKWPFIAGMVLYGLDGLLLLAAGDILSVVLHAYSLFAISRGLTVMNQPQRLKRVSVPQGL